VSAGEFTVYRVDQTKLATWVKNTDSYLTGTGDCGTTDIGNARTMKRTFNFSLETGSVNYSEVGLTWEVVGTNNPDLFSRILISGGAVTVLADQQLRLVYELTVTLTPSTPASFTADITGWPIAPSSSLGAVQQVQRFGLSNVSTTGSTQISDGGLDPGGYFTGSLGVRGVGLSPSSTAPAAFGSAVSRVTNAIGVASTLDTYTAGSFFRDILATFSAANGDRTDFRSLGFGNGTGQGSSAINHALSGSTNGFIVVFDESQTKDDEHSLTVRFRLSWGRDLS
jgi:hypothetical protein